MIDEGIKPFATPRQWEILLAIEAEGSQRAAARALGVNSSMISRSVTAVIACATKRGYAPDHDMTHPAPPGFKAKGVSTLYDMQSGEAKIQWVKTTADAEQQEIAFREAIAAMTETLPKVRSTKGPAEANADLLTLYPISDHHIGMMAWGEETGGEDYDLKRAEALLTGAMDYLISATPNSERAIIMVQGDFLHYDGFMPVTPTNKHLLDADSRFPKMVRVAIKVLRYLVAAALKKHKHVKLHVEIGNHDPASAIFLKESFAAIYENEPRLEVDTTPRPLSCTVFGKNLIGSHHGHSVKLSQLPMLFASDFPEEWGATVHRTIHTGHVHHDQVKELVGAVVESHRILAPADAYAANNGYKSMQSMKAIVLHREHGEMARHTFNPGMLSDA